MFALATPFRGAGRKRGPCGGAGDPFAGPALAFRELAVRRELVAVTAPVFPSYVMAAQAAIHDNPQQ